MSLLVLLTGDLALWAGQKSVSVETRNAAVVREASEAVQTLTPPQAQGTKPQVAPESVPSRTPTPEAAPRPAADSLPSALGGKPAAAVRASGFNLLSRDAADSLTKFMEANNPAEELNAYLALSYYADEVDMNGVALEASHPELMKRYKECKFRLVEHIQIITPECKATCQAGSSAHRTLELHNAAEGVPQPRDHVFSDYTSDIDATAYTDIEGLDVNTKMQNTLHALIVEKTGKPMRVDKKGNNLLKINFLSPSKCPEYNITFEAKRAEYAALLRMKEKYTDYIGLEAWQERLFKEGCIQIKGADGKLQTMAYKNAPWAQPPQVFQASGPASETKLFAFWANNMRQLKDCHENAPKYVGKYTALSMIYMENIYDDAKLLKITGQSSRSEVPELYKDAMRVFREELGGVESPQAEAIVVKLHEFNRGVAPRLVTDAYETFLEILPTLGLKHNMDAAKLRKIMSSSKALTTAMNSMVIGLTCVDEQDRTRLMQQMDNISEKAVKAPGKGKRRQVQFLKSLQRDLLGDMKRAVQRQLDFAIALKELDLLLSKHLDVPTVGNIVHQIGKGQMKRGGKLLDPTEIYWELEEKCGAGDFLNMEESKRRQDLLNYFDKAHPKEGVDIIKAFDNIDTTGKSSAEVKLTSRKGKTVTYNAPVSGKSSGNNFFMANLDNMPTDDTAPGPVPNKVSTADTAPTPGPGKMSMMDKGQCAITFFQGAQTLVTKGNCNTLEGREALASGFIDLIVSISMPLEAGMQGKESFVGKSLVAKVGAGAGVEVTRVIPGISTLAALNAIKNADAGEFGELAWSVVQDWAVLFAPKLVPGMFVVDMTRIFGGMAYSYYINSSKQNEFIDLLVKNGNWDKSDKLRPVLRKDKEIFINPPEKGQNPESAEAIRAGVIAIAITNLVFQDTFVNYRGKRVYPEKMLRELYADFLDQDTILLAKETCVNELGRQIGVPSKGLMKGTMADIGTGIGISSMPYSTRTADEWETIDLYEFVGRTLENDKFLSASKEFKMLLAYSVRDYWSRRQKLLLEKLMDEMVVMAQNSIAAQEVETDTDESIYDRITARLLALIKIEDAVWPRIHPKLYPLYREDAPGYSPGKGGPILAKVLGEMTAKFGVREDIVIQKLFKPAKSPLASVTRTPLESTLTENNPLGVTLDRGKLTELVNLIDKYVSDYGQLVESIDKFSGVTSANWSDTVWPLWVILNPKERNPETDVDEVIKVFKQYAEAIEDTQASCTSAFKVNPDRVNEWYDYVVRLAFEEIRLTLMSKTVVAQLPWVWEEFEKIRLEANTSDLPSVLKRLAKDSPETKSTGDIKTAYQQGNESIREEYRFFMQYLRAKFEVTVEHDSKEKELKTGKVTRFSASVKRDGNPVIFREQPSSRSGSSGFFGLSGSRKDSISGESSLMHLESLSWSLAAGERLIEVIKTEAPKWEYVLRRAGEFQVRVEAFGPFDLPFGEGTLKIDVARSPFNVRGELVINGDTYASQPVHVTVSSGGGVDLTAPGPFSIEVAGDATPEDAAWIDVQAKVTVEDKEYEGTARAKVDGEVAIMDKPLVIYVPWWVTIKATSVSLSGLDVSDRAMIMVNGNDLGRREGRLKAMAGDTIQVCTRVNIPDPVLSDQQVKTFNPPEQELTFQKLLIPYYEVGALSFQGALLAATAGGREIPILSAYVTCQAGYQKVNDARSYVFRNNLDLRKDQVLQIHAVGKTEGGGLLRTEAPGEVTIAEGMKRVTTDLRLVPKPIYLNPLVVHIKDLAGREPVLVALEIAPVGEVPVKNGLYRGAYTFSQWDQKLHLQATYSMEDGTKVTTPRLVKEWKEFITATYFSADLVLPVYLPGSLAVKGKVVFQQSPKQNVPTITVRSPTCGGSVGTPAKTPYTLQNEKTVRAGAVLSLTASAEAPPKTAWSGKAEVKAGAASVTAPDILLIETKGFEDVLNNLRESTQRENIKDNPSREDITGPDIQRVKEENARRRTAYEERIRQKDEQIRIEQERQESLAAAEREKAAQESRRREAEAERQSQEAVQMWERVFSAGQQNRTPANAPATPSQRRTASEPAQRSTASTPAVPSRPRVAKPSCNLDKCRKDLESCKSRRLEIIKMLEDARKVAADLRSGRTKSYSGLEQPDIRVRNLEDLLKANAGWIAFYEKELANCQRQWDEYYRNQ